MRVMLLKRPRTLIIFVMVVMLLCSAGALYAWHQASQKQVLLPSGHQGNCPTGYVDYGVPLGCISMDQYAHCQHYSCPICLSAGTTIDTEKGYVLVTNLKDGDRVWSVDANDHRVLVPIIRTSRRTVAKGTLLLSVTLSDDRHLIISPNHPTADGELFKTVTLGQVLDGSKVAKLSSISYMDGATYDLLPQSQTGNYWANGILVGSTLKRN